MAEQQEQRKIGAAEFVQTAEKLVPRIRGCASLPGKDKVMAQEVLEAVNRSVKVNGTAQHGVSKLKLRAALRVYTVLAAETEVNTPVEQKVLEGLMTIAAGALQK